MRDRVLAAVTDAASRVLVGPVDVVPPGVRVTREDPPGGGPVAAMAAGLALLDPGTTVVALLAADLPLLTRAAVGELLLHLDSDSATAPPAPTAGTVVSSAVVSSAVVSSAVVSSAVVSSAVGAGPGESGGGRRPDGACFVDADGRRQSLCGVWRVAALRAGLDRLAAERGGSLAGAPVRALLAGLVVREVPWSGDGPPPWFDCDTDEDVRRAEEWAR
ncbi:hypothetical protein GCM10027614_49870 [Micromonospora vulcania]